jgi:hypothetical protein
VNKESDSTGQRSGDSRPERREEAWGLGIQGYYDAALEILEDLLKEGPFDVISLRLKGNLLELKEMDLLEYSNRRLVSSPDYLAGGYVTKRYWKSIQGMFGLALILGIITRISMQMTRLSSITVKPCGCFSRGPKMRCGRRM